MEPETIRDAEVVSTPTTEPVEKKKSYRPLIAFVLGVLVSVGGFRMYEIFTTPVAAVVNGTRITMEQFEGDVAMMEKGAALQGVDVTDEAVKAEIRSQALNNLITNELLLGAAKKKGMTTNEAAVQTAYEELVGDLGGEEALTTRMAAVGLESDTLMENISDRLVVDAYLEAETDIEILTVSDEEVQAYAASMESAGISLPPLEEVGEQIKATLLAEKQQELVNTHIEKLRSEADIEIKVEGAEAEEDTGAPEAAETSETQIVDGK